MYCCDLEIAVLGIAVTWKLRSYIDNKKNQKNILKYHKQLFTA